VRPAPKDLGGNQFYPPIITWVYKEPAREVEEFFRQAIGTFRGKISWEFSVYEQAWVLMPSRITEYSKSHDDIGGLAAAHELMKSHPGFGKIANAELPRLIQHIQDQIRELGQKKGIRKGDKTRL
jgi:hypothetical protein